MKYHFLVYEDPGGTWGECLELNIATEEDKHGDFKEQATEVLNLYLDEPKDSDIIFPLPDDTIEISEGIVEIKVYDHIAMLLLNRQEKLEIIKIKEKYDSLRSEIKKEK